MAYRFEKENNGETAIIIDGFEKGIAPSPHRGMGNIQNANIATETGEVMCSYSRTQQAQLAGVSGTLTPTSQSTVSFTTEPLPGSWIHIVADSGTGLSGDYYYLGSGKLSTKFDKGTTFQVTTILTAATVTTFLTSGTSYAIPAGWSNAINTVETIGAGGGGGGGGVTGAGDEFGAGGGAGAYSKKSNITLTPSGTATYAVGAGGTGGAIGGATGVTGGDTWFNGATLAASTVGSKGGVGGASGAGATTGGLGGATATGIGTTKFAGGNGGDNLIGGNNGGGGGGAAGPNGAGANATNAGGTGDNGSGGTGGTHPGGAGGNGTEWTTHGSGGGGGGGNTGGGSAGANGGLYGAGGGGAAKQAGVAAAGGNGRAGLIRITYTPTTPITTSATYTVYSMTKPIQSAVETYGTDIVGTVFHRYFILDDDGNLWVYDDNTASFTVTAPTWAQVNAPYALAGRVASGLSVLNGWVSYTLGTAFVWLSTSYLSATSSSGDTAAVTPGFHATLTGHQGKLYYTDGNFIGSVFPNTSLLTGGPNVQSYASYTAVTTTGTVTALIGGSYPVIPNTSIRIPAVFFTAGTLPAALTANTVYYIKWIPFNTFEVYAAATGGAAKDIATGAVGTQYFNTFFPQHPNGSVTMVISPQRVNLPFSETAQCLSEVGNSVLIGCNSNTIYQWGQTSLLPDNFVVLPEINTVNMITVNQVAYAFSGNKGNIYITDGSTASLALKVPDYTAGIAGTQTSYFEPYFIWGGAGYIRGRLYFSIQDQTASKTGNCGGVWSFYPTQNMATEQDTGLSLRLENQNSYATYNGAASLIIPSLVQPAISPQYWAAWYSSITSSLYGIDFTNTAPSTVAVIETDLIPVGTMLDKKTFSQIEYKLAAPLVSGDSVALSWRANGTDAYTSLGTVKTESVTGLSGYVDVNLQALQWAQFKITLTPLASSSSSMVRLKQLYVR